MHDYVTDRQTDRQMALAEVCDILQFCEHLLTLSHQHSNGFPYQVFRGQGTGGLHRDCEGWSGVCEGVERVRG